TVSISGTSSATSTSSGTTASASGTASAGTASSGSAFAPSDGAAASSTSVSSGLTSPKRSRSIDSGATSGSSTRVRTASRGQLSRSVGRLEASDVAFHFRQLLVVRELAGLALETHGKDTAMGLFELLAQIGVGELADVVKFCLQLLRHRYISERARKRVGMGSLWAARRMASRAVSSPTPAIS